MATRKCSRKMRSASVPIDDVISAVVVGIGKANRAKRKRPASKGPRRKKTRKFRQFLPSDDSYDDSGDSDYEPEEELDRSGKISSYSKPSKKVRRKTGLRSQKQNRSRSVEVLPKKQKRRLIISSSNEENESFDEDYDEKPSTSKKNRPNNRKYAKKSTSPKAMSSNVSNIIDKTVRFVDSSSDDDELDVKLTSKNSYKLLKRPSLKRFRRSSSSEDLEKLSGTVQSKFIINNNSKLSLSDNNFETQKSTYSGKNLWGAEIPTEILIKIFQYAMISEGGAVPFLVRMQYVCRHWQKIAKSPMLWITVDLDFQKRITNEKPSLEYLSNFISYTKSLSLSRWENLRINEFEVLLQKNNKGVLDLDLSFCRALLPKGLFDVTLPTVCPNLHSLNISYVCTVQDSLATSLRSYLLQYGASLRCLYLNGNALGRFNVFCDALKKSRSMENLRVLDISRAVCQTTQATRTNILDFIIAFPNLTNLHMSDAMITFYLPEGVNLDDIEIWPNLFEFEFATTETWFGFQDVLECFMNCLSKCINLRRLNVSGHKLRGLLNFLNETPLTHLDISRTSAIDHSFVQTIEKWASTLKVLNVSWIKYYAVLPEICQLLTPSNRRPPPLKNLNVAGTPITGERLTSVIMACPFLEHLDCSSCRYLPLGMKRAYSFEEIRSLCDKLR